MFLFPCVLQHYVKFNIHTIATLEKILGMGFFGGFIGHLVYRHAIFFFFWASLVYLLWFRLLPPHSWGVGH
jgi:hypothetical protein